LKTVDSQALGIVNRALGLTGVGAPLTEFLDGQLDQVLDVGSLVRRGRTLAGSGGMFFGLLRNIHAAANSQVSEIQPYFPNGAEIDPYPNRVPLGFDVWVLAATVEQLSGTGTFTGALFMDPAANSQGWGIDQAGAAVTGDRPMPLAFWDSVVAQDRTIALQEDGSPWVRIGMRLMRNAQSNTGLRFSSTSSALATFDCYILLGFFPIGLGQDGLI